MVNCCYYHGINCDCLRFNRQSRKITGGNLSLPGTWVSGEYTTEFTGTQVTFTVGSETYGPWDYNLSGTTLTITNNPDYPDYLADTLVALTIGSGSTSFTGNFEYVINGAGTLTFEKQ